MRTYPEPLVARVTGLKKRRLVAVRRASLVRGDDWQIERNVVHYTPAGLEKLLAALGLASATLVWPEASATPSLAEASASVDDDVDGASLDDDEEADDEGEDDESGPETAPAAEAQIEAIAGTPEASPQPTPSPESPPKIDLSAATPGPAMPSEAPASSATITAALDELIEGAARPVELRVLRISHNPTMLFAHKGDRKELRVRVASNANFLPGMTLNALPPAKGGPDIWHMVGRCPRWRGRY